MIDNQGEEGQEKRSKGGKEKGVTKDGKGRGEGTR